MASRRSPIPWWTPSLGEREKSLVCKVIDRQFPNDGEYTARFEQRIAAWCGVPYAVAVTSGTAAMFLALAGCGVGPGDEVIVPDLTFIATANAVRLAGATPVLVDVRENDLTIDLHQVELALTDRTKALMPVHVSGRAAAMASLVELANRRHLAVIEDAAEALGSGVGGRPLGTFGDAGCFSFSPNKTLTTGQGGMVVTRNAVLHQRLRELKDQGRPVRGTGGADEHPSLGYNFKFTDLQAAVGLAQWEVVPERIEHQRRVFRWYQERLKGVAGVRLPGFNLETGECPQWVDAVVEDRDGLHDYLLAQGILTRKFWFPVHTQGPYRCSGERFAISTRLSHSGLWLSSDLSLTETEVDVVCEAMRDWSRRRS